MPRAPGLLTGAGRPRCLRLPGGVHLFGGVVSALLYRERTGEGQLVEWPCSRPRVWPLASAIGVFMDATPRCRRARAPHPALAVAPYNSIPSVTATSPSSPPPSATGTTSPRVLGREDLLDDPTMPPRPGAPRARGDRRAGRGRGRARARRPSVAGAHRGSRALRAGQNHGGGGERSHLAARGMWTEIDHPRRGRRACRTRRSAYTAARRGRSSGWPAARPDTDRVLAELLGLVVDELAALHAAGVIEPVKS